MSDVTILSTADLHLGRRPARVPVEVEGVSTVDGWWNVVEEAERRDVDVVVMAGDIVDADNQLYEAFGPLQQGVTRLADRGIWTIAVGGNHDHSVMNRLADIVESERWCFLGRDGEWARRRLEWEDGRKLDIFGWSFPSAQYDKSPLREFPEREADGVPAVGVVHGEFGAAESPYAPVPSSHLDETGLSTWIFGHRHTYQRPDWPNGEVVYPGTPQPLDPNETGIHGAGLLTVNDAGGSAAIDQIDLAGLAYVHTEIDVGSVDGKAAFEQHVSQALQRQHQEVVESRRQLEWVVHRLELVGRTEVHRHLDTWSQQLRERFRPEFEAAPGHVDTVEVRARPTHDLQQLAKNDDPPGVLARMMLAAGAGEADADASLLLEDDDVEALVRRMRRGMHDDIFTSNAFAPLQGDEETADAPTRADALQLLRERGWELLDALLAQRAVDGEGGAGR